METLAAILSFLFVFGVVLWKGWKDLEDDSFNISPCGRVCKYTLLILFFPVIYGEDIVNFFRGGWIKEKKKKALQQAEKEKYKEHIREFVNDLLSFLDTIESEKIPAGKLKEQLDTTRKDLTKEYEPYTRFDGTFDSSTLASDLCGMPYFLAESEEGLEILSRLLEHLEQRPVPLPEYHEFIAGLYGAKLKHFENNRDESLSLARRLASFLKISGLADESTLQRLAYAYLYHRKEDELNAQVELLDDRQREVMTRAQSQAWAELSKKYREEGKYEDAYGALENITHSTLDALYEAGALVDGLDVTDLYDLKKEVVRVMIKSSITRRRWFGYDLRRVLWGVCA